MRYAGVTSMAIGLILLGCSKAPIESEAPLPKPPALDFSTPDRALKSYWANKDWVDALYTRKNAAFLKEYRQERPKMKELVAQTTTGDLKAYLIEPENPETEADVLKREIESVKQETDSRAVAITRIKHVGKIPADATPTPAQVLEREKGTAFRYIIEKDSGLWKVAEVWRFADYKKDWLRVYEKSKPSVATEVWAD